MPSSWATSVGTSDNGILVEDWRYDMQSLYSNLMFGSSSCIADLDVNNVGGEPNSDLEIIVGSDEYYNYYPELGAYARGIWRVLDSQGNLEWAKDTGTDESRSSPTVADMTGDGYLDIIGGTTSGWNVEVIDRFGNFIWTFPWPPQGGGPFMWHSSPAIADVDPSVGGMEVFIGNNPYQSVWALDGDNSDGVDDGITATDAWIYGGVEGVDWDVLWKFQTNGIVYSTPALGDVDNDGGIEVVIGSADGNIYILDGVSGVQEYSYATSGIVHASAAIANLDSDPYLEVVIGSVDGKVYCLQWDGIVGTVEWTYNTGSPIYSSAAIGDIDNDGNLEIVDASSNGDIFALDTSGMLEWIYSTGSYIVSSPALANRFCTNTYDAEWPMFRHDKERTGYYGSGSSSFGLDIYIGAYDHYLYLIDGGGGGWSGGTLIDRFLTYGHLYTSPSVADVDGDKKLEIVFYDAEPGHDGHYTYWCIEDCGINILQKTVIGYFTLTQGDTTWVIDPIERSESAADFYDYYSVSAHTGFEEPFHSFVYLYRDITDPSNEVSLFLVHDIDGNYNHPIYGLNSGSPDAQSHMDLSGIPTGAYIAQGDEPVEFSFTGPSTAEGRWHWWYNTDGGAISGLTTSSSWCITIDPIFWADVGFWEYYIEGNSNIPLNMTLPITICYNPPSLIIIEKTDVHWVLEFKVTNLFNYKIEDTIIKDNFGGEIEIDEILLQTHGDLTITLKGKTQKVQLLWEIGDLDPGETAKLILHISTDLNPAGHQEYTTPGIYELNSGATLKFFDPVQGKQLSKSTDSIYVIVYSEPLDTHITGDTLTEDIIEDKDSFSIIDRTLYKQILEKFLARLIQRFPIMTKILNQII
jgi:hypothetical protein